jgi:DNA-binding NtrC family response regulator
VRVGDVLPRGEGRWLVVDGAATQRALLEGVRLFRERRPVVVVGHTGSGRRALVEALHEAEGGQNGEPLLTLDLRAAPEADLSARLFGRYRRGSKRQLGALERAEGGTLALIGLERLPPALEARLDLALAEGVLMRDGGEGELKLRARVVLICQQGAQGGAGAMVRQSWARRVLTVEALSRRGPEAIQRLATHLLAGPRVPMQRYTPTLSEEALRCLQAYGWPGHVTELKRCIEACALLAANTVTVQDLPPALRDGWAPRSLLEAEDAGPFAGLPSLDVLEARYIAHVLAAVGGSRSEAARRLGIGRNTLLSKLRRYRLT